MKYRILFKSRHEPAQYVTTCDGVINWTSPALRGFVGETIEKLIGWLDFKRAGTWSCIGPQIHPPKAERKPIKVTRRKVA